MNKLPYIHLRTQSSYSLAEGALKIKRIVELAKINNMPAIALTDKMKNEANKMMIAYEVGIFFSNIESPPLDR